MAALGVDGPAARAYGEQVVQAVGTAAPGAVDGVITVPEVRKAAVPRGTKDADYWVRRIQAIMNDEASFDPDEYLGSVPEPLRAEVRKRLLTDNVPQEALQARESMAQKAKGGKVTLSPEDIAALAKVVRQDSDKPRGPLKALHSLIGKWDDLLAKVENGLTGARSEAKLAEHIGNRQALSSILHGEMQAFAEELGPANMDAVVAHIKAQDEKEGGKQAQGNIRFAVAWNQFKNNRLLSESVGSNEIRGNKAEEGARTEGSKLEDVLAAYAEKAKAGEHPFKDKFKAKSWAELHPGEELPSDAHFRILGALDYFMQHSPNAMTRVMGRALRAFFEKTGADFTIVVNDKSDNNGVGNFNMKTRVLTINPKGRNERTMLHELVHAATADYIYKHYGTDDPHVARFEATLQALVNAVDGVGVADFVKKAKLDAEGQARLQSALKTVVDGYAQATGDAGRRRALAEFVSYGLTEAPFQAYLKTLRSSTAEPFNVHSAKRTVLTLWSRFVDAMSHLLLGRAWKDADGSLMARFLSDSAHLMSASMAEGTEAQSGPRLNEGADEPLKPGDVVVLNLPWVPGGYKVTAVVAGTKAYDKNGREDRYGEPQTLMRYVVNGETITYPFSKASLAKNIVSREGSSASTTLQEDAVDIPVEAVRPPSPG